MNKSENNKKQNNKNIKLGLMLPFFTEIDIRRRLELLKEAGFESLLFSFDKKHEKFLAPCEKVKKICDELKIEIGSAHASYSEPEINNFWEDNSIGNKIEKQYLEEIELAYKLKIKTVVFHLHCTTNFNMNETGIMRLRKMVQKAESLGVNLAIENLYNIKELDYIFENIKSKNLGICYDTGHENFLTPNVRLLKKFGGKLFATHIADNNGRADQHATVFTGTINWNDMAKDLANSNHVNLDGEIRMHRPNGKTCITEKELLKLYKKEYAALKKLSKLVLNNKK